MRTKTSNVGGAARSAALLCANENRKRHLELTLLKGEGDFLRRLVKAIRAGDWPARTN